jgi:hypothetical protein
MAKRYSGDVVLDIRWMEAKHESPAQREKLARGCPHNGYYRVSISVRGEHVDTGTICAPAFLEHGIDSAEAYDDTARTALAFAMNDGKLSDADIAYDGDNVWIGRREKDQARFSAPEKSLHRILQRSMPGLRRR